MSDTVQDTRDRVMRSYPGVIVFGIVPAAANAPETPTATAPRYYIMDKRLVGDPSVTAGQQALRDAAFAASEAVRGNKNGDSLVGERQTITQAGIDTNYPAVSVP